MRVIRRCFWVFTIVSTLGPLIDNRLLQADETSRFLDGMTKKHSSVDMDHDGVIEINSLKRLDWGTTDNATSDSLSGAESVLILLEKRILATLPDGAIDSNALQAELRTYCEDLRNEGYQPHVIVCDLYAGEMHQDGLTLLALRRFLGDVHKEITLKGVVLIGSFPEASIVRRWVWRREGWDVTIAGKSYGGPDQKPFLRIVPESVAPRADIVLADLDGNWESIYHKGPAKLDSIEALPPPDLTEWPTDGMIFESTEFNDQAVQFQDFFAVLDDDFERLTSTPGTLRLKISTQQRNPEIAESDRARANPMACPEILISRINPRHVAVMPDPNFRDRNGKGLLDDQGKPQSIETASKINPAGLFHRDAAFERRLLVDHLRCNHQFRTERSQASSRTAAASFGSGLIGAASFNAYLSKASTEFSTPIPFDNASLLQFVELARTPARLKGISAHSSPWNSAFGSNYDVAELEDRVGGKPWRWKEQRTDQGFRYVPSLADQHGTADSYIFRTIYENGILKDVGGSLIIHNGCEVNTPEGSLHLPFNHPGYGSAGGFQNAESVLFFLNGVALAARSKVFYDTPRGFTEAMGEGGCFGEGLRSYFLVESQDAELAKSVASCKRTYPWSIVGDWTLTVKTETSRSAAKE